MTYRQWRSACIIVAVVVVFVVFIVVVVVALDIVVVVYKLALRVLSLLHNIIITERLIIYYN